MPSLPAQIQINAWTDDADNRSDLEAGLSGRLLAKKLALPSGFLAIKPIDKREWSDPRVGWGLVLPDNKAMSAPDKAVAADASEALRRLLAHRSGIVLRHDPDGAFGALRRDYPDGISEEVWPASFGTGPGEVPLYLTIAASPAQIPWQVQFDLQASSFVGRLDLDDVELENYVEAIIGEWSGSAANSAHTLVWAVDHGIDDITHLMRNAIAAPLNQRYAADNGISSRFIDGFTGAAGAAELIAGLGEQRPIVIATTSHGQTGPLGDVPAMQRDLGLLVDADKKIAEPAALLADWQPDGAVWYAHACCSAGTRATSNFLDYVSPGSDVERILRGLQACGEMSAPLPRALLGATRPLRGFVGHVEPTFDYSVEHPRTGQWLTQPLLRAFYEGLFAGEPIGHALDGCRRTAASLLNAQRTAERSLAAAGKDRRSEFLALNLMAGDWNAFVLLGDPACAIPKLP